MQENFLYEKEGSDFLKLIGFGLATRYLATESSTLTQECGSLLYVAPEVLNGSYTQQADIWSVPEHFLCLLSVSHARIVFHSFL